MQKIDVNLLVFFLLFSPIAAIAQSYNPAVGETILCSPVGNETDWREGVVLENNSALDYVRVKCGPGLNGNPGNIFLVGRDYLRPSSDPEGRRKAGLAPASAPSNGTSPVAPVANQPQGQPPVQATATHPRTSVQPPTGSNLDVPGLEGTFKRLIAARYMKDGRALDAGHTPATITFHSFSIGAARPYKMPTPGGDLGSPDGPGGAAGTQVYPVKTRYTVAYDYPGNEYGTYNGAIEYVDVEGGYWFFKGAFNGGQWIGNQVLGTQVTTRRVDK